jgi:zinc transport system substrate-binding protein
VKRQAEVISSSLENLDREHAATYGANAQRFLARIDELDAQLRSILESKKGMKFMVFHPSWGYFAESYGLEQVPVEIEGKSPKPAHLKELIELARREQISVIFAQPQLSRKSAQVIAREIDAQVVLIDPLGEDWFANMRAVADKMAAAVR